MEREEAEAELQRLMSATDDKLGFMSESYKKLHMLTRYDDMQTVTELCSGVSRESLEHSVEEELRMLQCVRDTLRRMRMTANGAAAAATRCSRCCRSSKTRSSTRT